MTPITVLMFAMTLFSCTMAANSECLSWLFKSDAFAAANRLLVGGTESGDFLDNIEAAREVLETGRGLSNDPNVEQILKQFVASEPLVEQCRGKKITCSYGDMALMRGMNELMKNHSRGNAYTEPRSEDRLNKLILNLQEDFGKTCLEEFQTEYETMGIDAKKERALTALSNLLKTFGALPSMALLEKAALGVHVPRGYPKTLSREQLGKYYGETVTDVCNYFIDYRKDAAIVFEKTLELARSVKLTRFMDFPEDWTRKYAKAVAGYRVCKDLSSADQMKLAEAIIKPARIICARRSG